MAEALIYRKTFLRRQRARGRNLTNFDGFFALAALTMAGLRSMLALTPTDGPCRLEQCRIRMSVRDLVKATVVCGLSAYFVYSYPVVGQVLIIGGLTLLWLSYALSLVRRLRR